MSKKLRILFFLSVYFRDPKSKNDCSLSKWTYTINNNNNTDCFISGPKARQSSLLDMSYV